MSDITIDPDADAPPADPPPADPKQHWLERIDDWATVWGDRFNPILIKETRQALKSRQFVVTFSLLLIAALAWTVIGSLSMMPQIYSRPSAPRMLMGYYIVLAVPMLLVVPMAAYRSLENEIDDGTLELLSITTLSPWQIILGKLASALLQILLYFVALFPCVAYAYNLRGVDLPTIAALIGSLLLVAILLTIVGLFFAPLAISRSGRILTLLALLSLLIGTQYGISTIVSGVIYGSNTLSPTGLLAFTAGLAAVVVPLGHLLLTVTAAQLTPLSENRSTGIRVSLLIFTAVGFGLCVLATAVAPSIFNDDAFVIANGILVGLCALWLLSGAMMSGESGVITPRMRRELPGSFLERVTLTFLTPGPITGLILAVVVGNLLAASHFLWVEFAAAQRNFPAWRYAGYSSLSIALVVIATYASLFLCIVHWMMRGIRAVSKTVRVEASIAALVVVMVVAALLPYAVGLHMNDYREYNLKYSRWQITNWAWTAGQAGVPTAGGIWFDNTIIIGCLAALGLITTLITSPKLVFPRRIAKPKRVEQEEKLLRDGSSDGEFSM